MNEIERAGELFLEGYNCAQAVFTAFCYRFGMDEETAKRVSAGLGGGVGRMREVCGAVSGAAMVLGSVASAVSGDDKQGKAKNYELVRQFAERFKERHGGTVICREMLKLNTMSSRVPSEPCRKPTILVVLPPTSMPRTTEPFVRRFSVMTKEVLSTEQACVRKPIHYSYR